MDICPDDLIRTDQVDILDPTYIDRHILIVSESDSGLIHDSQILMESLFEREYIIANCISMFFGVFIIDPIYLGSLDYTVTLELESPEY